MQRMRRGNRLSLDGFAKPAHRTLYFRQLWHSTKVLA
jgi:hypothetical protein